MSSVEERSGPISRLNFAAFRSLINCRRHTPRSDTTVPIRRTIAIVKETGKQTQNTEQDEKFMANKVLISVLLKSSQDGNVTA